MNTATKAMKILFGHFQHIVQKNYRITTVNEKRITADGSNRITADSEY